MAVSGHVAVEGQVSVCRLVVGSGQVGMNGLLLGRAGGRVHPSPRGLLGWALSHGLAGMHR